MLVCEVCHAVQRGRYWQPESSLTLPGFKGVTALHHRSLFEVCSVKHGDYQERIEGSRGGTRMSALKLPRQ